MCYSPQMLRRWVLLVAGAACVIFLVGASAVTVSAQADELAGKPADAGTDPTSIYRSLPVAFDHEWCLERSLGGPVAHPADSDGDGWADTCAVRISRRAAIAHQRALEALADRYRDAFEVLLSEECQFEDGCRIIAPPPLPPPDHPTYWSGPISAADICSKSSSGGQVTYPFDSNGDGVADTCSLPTSRRVALARQKALEALASRYHDDYIELVTQGCKRPGSEQADGECSPWLGVVKVQPGDSVQIRSLSFLAGVGNSDNLRAARFAIADYGLIHGQVEVSLGEPLNDECNTKSGEHLGRLTTEDSQVIGIVGPTCSSTATTLSPRLSAAGMVMISPSNTSPFLTSDLTGTPGRYYYPGYYRTSYNDNYQGHALADLLTEHLSIDRAAVIHDGDAYTLGLAESFRKYFEQHDGTITDFVQLASDETEVLDTLKGIASKQPGALFLPLNEDLANAILKQATDLSAFDEVVVLAGDGLTSSAFLRQAFTKGIYVSTPDQRFTSGENEITGISQQELRQRFIDTSDEMPEIGFWAHAYDATVLLLEAIRSASYIVPDTSQGSDPLHTLYIDRARVRTYLSKVNNFQGVSGNISCDPFGDCGEPHIDIIHNIDPSNIDNIFDNVVCSYTSESPCTPV